jgi:hypothetical protein
MQNALPEAAHDPCTQELDDKRTDTGLHISMRALLGIIAGLLVAEAVKACVLAVTAGAASEPTTWLNAAVALAGTLFITRVVVDNFLYYADPDILTGFDDYPTRVTLIVLDLISYAACYAIVARITISADTLVLTTAAVRWSVTYATVVELSHAVWCSIALRCLHIEHATDRETRQPWLRVWLLTSAVSFAIGLGLSLAAWYAFWPGRDVLPAWLALSALVVSLFSVATYLCVMRKQYLRRRPL